MDTKRIDLINIGLMLFSAVAAFVFPFEVFLLSYAILGPLHYLTEISWLHKRNYFTNRKKDYVWLLVVGVVLTVIVLSRFYKESPPFSNMNGILISGFGENYFTFSNVLIFVAFATSLTLVLFKDVLSRILVFALTVIIGIAFAQKNPFIVLFGIFLPTLIHVFVFTGLFILGGALKNRSVTGIISIVVFIGCAVSFFVFNPHFSFYHITARASDAIDKSGFIGVNEAILQILQFGHYLGDQMTQGQYDQIHHAAFDPSTGFSIMRFIAFAYTYHYLNWFSKTQVIKWHQVPKNQLIFVVLVWAGSIILYAYNYVTGLMWLYFLSMLHVFLEFPLNYRSFIGIGQDLALITGLKRPVPVKSGGGKRK